MLLRLLLAIAALRCALGQDEEIPERLFNPPPEPGAAAATGGGAQPAVPARWPFVCVLDAATLPPVESLSADGGPEPNRGDAAAAVLAAAGHQVEFVDDHSVTLVMSADEAANSSAVREVCRSIDWQYAETNALDTTQGVQAMYVDYARDRLNAQLDGSGVKVGILSDSYWATTATKNSPCAAVNAATILKDYASSSSLRVADEGRAMAELVCFIAPKAQIFFHTANPSQQVFASGIKALQAAGCQVIVDDINYFNAPRFSPGVLAQAVEAVFAAGSAYFSSACNYADKSWEAFFLPMAVGAERWLNFGTAGAPARWMRLTLKKLKSKNGIAVLQWDEAFYSATNGAKGADSNLDVFLCKTQAVSVATCSFGRVRNEGKDAYEDFTVDTDKLLGVGATAGASGTVFLAIQLMATKRTASSIRMKLIWSRELDLAIVAPAGNSLGFSTDQPHANTAAAMSVGAARYTETPRFGVDPAVMEEFSSWGGTPLYLNAAGKRLDSPIKHRKPDIVAPDGTQTSFFQTQATDGNFYFFGTSAAAPHAAALAALVLQLHPGYKPADVYETMRLNVDPIGKPGWDRRSGYGLVSAWALLATPATSGVCTNALTAMDGANAFDSWLSPLTLARGCPVGHVQSLMWATVPTKWSSRSYNTALFTYTPSTTATYDFTACFDGAMNLVLQIFNTSAAACNLTAASALVCASKETTPAGACSSSQRLRATARLKARLDYVIAIGGHTALAVGDGVLHISPRAMSVSAPVSWSLRTSRGGLAAVPVAAEGATHA